jgi:hypothetical protein
MPDPLGLLSEIRKEFQVIKNAPFSFSVVCIASFLICWGLFEADLHLKSETVQAYKERLESINSTIKTSSSQPLQMVNYSSDPNAEKIIPANINQPAIAYSEDGTKPLYTWSVKSQSWK